MIRVEGLVKRHGSSDVLRGLRMAVTKGEVAAVIGPSGGGKSTFLRCLNGLERFQEGIIRIGEHTLTPATHPGRDAALLQAVRLRLGFVFQQFNLFPHMSVLENVIEAPIQVRRLDREQAIAKARELLERVGLSDKLAARPRELSGGQQQRVAIARALAMEPDALLFDEPTSALDPVMAGEILDVITDLARRHQTMIVVTHQMSFARKVADTVHVFSGGVAVESGPPATVLTSPRSEVTRAFLERAE